MGDEPEVNDEFSRKLTELLRLIEQLPPDRQEQLRQELEAGTLDPGTVRRVEQDKG